MSPFFKRQKKKKRTKKGREKKEQKKNHIFFVNETLHGYKTRCSRASIHNVRKGALFYSTFPVTFLDSVIEEFNDTDRFYRDRHPFRGRTVVADPTRKSSSSWFDFHDNGTRPGLNARRLGAIDRPVASPYSTSEIPGLFVTATIHPRLLNVDPRAQETRLRLCRRDNGLPGFPTSFYTRARIILRTVEYLRVRSIWLIDQEFNKTSRVSFCKKLTKIVISVNQNQFSSSFNITA